MTKPASPQRIAELKRRYLAARTYNEQRHLRRAILRTVARMAKR